TIATERPRACRCRAAETPTIPAPRTTTSTLASGMKILLARPLRMARRARATSLLPVLRPSCGEKGTLRFARHDGVRGGRTLHNGRPDDPSLFPPGYGRGLGAADAVQNLVRDRSACLR